MRIYKKTADKKQEFLRLVDSGMTPFNAGRQVGVSENQRRRWLIGKVAVEPLPEDLSPKILLYDIETNPNLVFCYDLYSKSPIPVEHVVEGKSITSIAYKFLGDSEVKTISLLDYDPKVPYDDKGIIDEFLSVHNSADFIVAHNGDNFDQKMVAARAFANGLPSPAPITSVDTCKLARGKFGRMLNSNKLDHLAKLLNVKRKMETSRGLTYRVAMGDIEALKELVEYNKVDVEVLEQVFVRLLPHVQSKLNWNLFVEDCVHHCKQCNSDNLELNGYYYTQATIKHRYRCLDCGSWSLMRG